LSQGSHGSRELGVRLEKLGRGLGEREGAHASDLEAARARAGELREAVAAALERFLEEATAP
jgi:hypothetical protein